MYAIDLTYFFNKKECDNEEPFSSVFIVDILDSFIAFGVHNNIVLIIYSFQENYIRSRFPGFKIFVIDFGLTKIIYEKRNKFRGFSILKNLLIWRININKEIEKIWIPLAFPTEVVQIKKQKILTIHDLLRYHYAPEKTKTDYKKMFLASDNIVAISEYTKNDILNSIDVNLNISVIPNSIEKKEFDYDNFYINNLPSKYILDINGFVKHKNTITLIKAFERVLDKIPHSLVLVGNNMNSEYFEFIKTHIEEAGFKDRVQFFSQISEKEKIFIIKNADIFVTPSLNEGFGRTPIEAAIFGVPVITTKCTSLYEVTLGILNYYEEPCDDEELANKILQLINNRPRKGILKNISKQFETKYNSLQCAKLYYNLFESL